jgi:hypothetical protein
MMDALDQFMIDDCPHQRVMHCQEHLVAASLRRAQRRRHRRRRTRRRAERPVDDAMALPLLPTDSDTRSDEASALDASHSDSSRDTNSDIQDDYSSSSVDAGLHSSDGGGSDDENTGPSGVALVRAQSRHERRLQRSAARKMQLLAEKIAQDALDADAAAEEAAWEVLLAKQKQEYLALVYARVSAPVQYAAGCGFFNPEYVAVDRVLWHKHKDKKKDHITDYVIKWGAQPYSDCSWESVSDLYKVPGATAAIYKYHPRAHSELPDSPRFSC